MFARLLFVLVEPCQRTESNNRGMTPSAEREGEEREEEGEEEGEEERRGGGERGGGGRGGGRGGGEMQRSPEE